MVTADAMHTQTDTAQWIRNQGGRYLLTVKDNQPGVRKTLKKLPWKNVPSVSSVDTSHGRWVRRTVKAVERGLPLAVGYGGWFTRRLPA